MLTWQREGTIHTGMLFGTPDCPFRIFFLAVGALTFPCRAVLRMLCLGPAGPSGWIWSFIPGVAAHSMCGSGGISGLHTDCGSKRTL